MQLKLAMRVIVRYLFFYLAATFFFIVYNYLLDLMFFEIDYGHIKGIINGLGYLGYFILMYSPLFLPFLIFYNYAVNEIFLIEKQRFWRYLTALLLGIVIGVLIGRKGVSFYIGSYRFLKNIILFGMIMLSLEITRDIVLNFRNRKKMIFHQ